MKNIQNLLYTILVCFAFTSCEKVISIDLNNAEKKYVIEAVVTNQTGGSKVSITQTKDFAQDNTFEGISGAVITIKTSTGTTTTLTETTKGIYEPAATFSGVIGSTYTITVAVGGQTFTANSTMPAQVNLDSVYITDDELFGEPEKVVNVDYIDPIGKGNSYKFVQYRNGIKEKAIFLRTDEFTDGNLTHTKLLSFNDDDDDDDKIKKGDTIKVDMLCIDKTVYKYWYSLDQGSTGTNNSATPANPVSNIQGGALGYFSAHTYQTKSLIVP